MKTVKAVLAVIVKAGDESHAVDSRTYDIGEYSPLADYAVLMTVKTHVHCKAMMSALEKAFSELKLSDAPDFFPHPHVSGTPESGWVILDFNSILVHIVQEEFRELYHLDEVYSKQGVIYYN